MINLLDYKDDVYQIIGTAIVQLSTNSQQANWSLNKNFGENDLISERWAHNNETNDCFLVDKDMQPLYNKNYDNLIY